MNMDQGEYILMDNYLHLLIDFAIILILILGIRFFRTPKGARLGNFTAAFVILCALVLVLYRNKIFDPGIVIFFLIVGSAIGVIVAVRVNMIQIPAMVAFQHGAGGVAVFLISFVELTKATVHLTAIGKISGILGLIIGAATFSGSMIASGKLANKLKQTPISFPKHDWLLLGILFTIIVFSIIAGNSFNPVIVYYLIALIVLSVILGIVFSIRIGGADMPVLISFLNATAGLAAAFCGIVIQNRLLIACGATVASSGSILTLVMCKAMNRKLFNVFIGTKSKPASTFKENIIDEEVKKQSTEIPVAMQDSALKDPFDRTIEIARNSQKVVIIPGYGMALSQAQFKVVELANKLEEMGKEVKFAIHPVAGRMPGHMNVLLAEADIDYENLIEMEDINPEFKETDLVLIVGACDVVNPVALEQEDTPISGMPILMAQEAKTVVVCNLDEKPGYSGVENSLYKNKKTIMLLGDAKDIVDQLLEKLNISK